MAQSTYLSAVNQKCLFAAQLLASANKKSSHQTVALVQSVALQLYQAWHWHLCDIASSYKVAEPDRVTDADNLVEMLEAMGKCPAEASEMRSLLADRDSWALLWYPWPAVAQLAIMHKRSGLDEPGSQLVSETTSEHIPDALGSLDKRT